MTFYLFIALMGFFNACMDAWENENYFESIFKHWPQRFWYKRESWKYIKKFLGYRFDGWHISKSLWELCFIGAIVCKPEAGSWWVIALNTVIVYKGMFNVFYHVLYKIK